MSGARLIQLYGIVQGVGFRPFVRRAADRCGVTGSVANKGSYVEVHAQGTPAQLDAFQEILRTQAPERSSVLKMDIRTAEEPPAAAFSILESEKEAGEIFVSPDIAICEKCKSELLDPRNRRYLHPFINCTACGPRLTILDAMPYDRERTTMGAFPMCPQCAYEYTHPQTRRYDAQPVCCNDCGPEVFLLGRAERNRAAITEARRAIMAGKIVAVKGIGGFHLCCNALDEEAVARLRQLKHRPQKPFAVMMRDLDCVKKECLLLPGQAKILDGHQKPILLLKRRPDSRLAPSVSPDNPRVGVMLPYAPVQLLLFSYDDPTSMADCLVMTSGNVSGAPICRSDEDAAAEIAGFCDLILTHNRTIRLRADDSVMDFFEGKPYMIRRSRGYAPLPFLLSRPYRGQVLGIGGELKNTFCLGKNELFYPSPYIGDMADRRTVDTLEESVVRMEKLLEISPQAVACDLHPKYNTAAVAEGLGLPVLRVQHHYAHILSCLAENDYAGPVIGVSFDGTGYGTDGTLWGGEFLRADCRSFTRLGSIQPFVQPGGDASTRDGWRIAASLLSALFGGEGGALAQALGLCTRQQYHVTSVMAAKQINSVLSTSAGRLFDAVSAILGIRRTSTFEGEAAVALQFAAEAYSTAWDGERLLPTGPPHRSGGQGFVLSTHALVGAVVRAKLAGEESSKLAYAFHSALADLITAGCVESRKQTGLAVCALSGGVFQNCLLTGMCAARLRGEGFQVLLHSLIPPNDGGICLGQAVYAMEIIQPSHGKH